MAESNVQRLKNTDLNDPNEIETPIRRLIQFPLDLTFPGSSDAGPYMEISCFKYARSFVKNTEESLYKIFLPFPFQGISYGISLNYDPFSALLGRGEGIPDQVAQGAASEASKAIANGGTEILTNAINKIPGFDIDADRVRNQASSVLGITFNPRQ